MNRNVKGVLFADYVRMIRSQKAVDWRRELAAEDIPFLTQRIEPSGWYPMATFERMGDAILRNIAHGDLQAVRMWGRFQADLLWAQTPLLVAEGNPVETLHRFRVLRSTFFDFDTLDVPMLHDDEAYVVICYRMGHSAEEAASFQTMGFFERLLELAGANDVSARFLERSWSGDARTLLALAWRVAPSN